ncbi:CB1 cannabinoid receptor-interacting protein 1 isoform X2 [Strix uralensis]|uniref:CB1 cannabinoid receptor-interacting protein 1 isoform X2 n=1 Tax=Strix uralensis TaxID=36305 RepID=UPI003DA725DD
MSPSPGDRGGWGGVWCIRRPDAAPRLGGGKNQIDHPLLLGRAGLAGIRQPLLFLLPPPLPLPRSLALLSRPAAFRGGGETSAKPAAPPPSPPPRRQAMGDIPGLVKISVSLKIQPNDGAVYFKVDGQRFGQNRTIKLLTGAKYKIEVALRPGTVQATTMGIGGVNVPLEEISRDAQVASYTGIYDTEGVPHTKSGERQPIQVNMQRTDTPAPFIPNSKEQPGIPSDNFCSL